MTGATAVGGLKITISLRSLLSFPGGSVVKNSPANAENTGSIPGWGRSPGEENGKPLQYSCLENPTDRGAWQAMVHGVAESDTTMQLSTYTQDPFHLRHSTILSKFSREDCTVAADFSLSFFLAYGILVPGPGMEPVPPAVAVWTTGLPGKSLLIFLLSRASFRIRVK